MSPTLLLAAFLALTAEGRGDPLAPLPEDRWTLEAARHLLDRAGFGAPPQEVRRVHRMGLDRALDWLLDPGSPPVTFEAAPLRGRAALLAMGREMGLRSRADLDAETRKRLRRMARRADRRQAGDYRDFWIRRMIEGDARLREKMALFWHGHFTSSQREVRNSLYMVREIELFRREGLGSFRRLLHAVAKEPAMLVYLDAAKNVKEHPNENFAREVMELFTLGIGHYGERDVKEAARAFTGWSVRGDEFRFRRRAHDDGVKTILGRTGRFDGDDVLDILLEEEATPRHLARRLLAFFARPDPPEEVVEALAAEIRRQDYELAPVLRRLFRSAFFYDVECLGSLIKSPVEYVVGLVRRLGLEPPPGPFLAVACDALGQSLLFPPSVKGWDGGEAWIDAQTILLRANVAKVLVRGLGRDGYRALRQEGARGPLVEALRALRRWRPGLDAGELTGGARTSREALARLCDRLLSVAPEVEALEPIRRHLAPFGDDAFDPADPSTARRVLDACWMIAALPEGQLH